MHVCILMFITNNHLVHLYVNVLYIEMMSEAVKILKGEYTVRAIQEHRMDKAIVFCRTKVDCDNMEQYLQQQGKSMFAVLPNIMLYYIV